MEDIKDIKSGLKPIVAYGNSILRKKCSQVDSVNDNVNLLLENLWYTMSLSGGVGLAAPQINEAYKVFVVNSKLMYDDIGESERKQLFIGDSGIEESFINAKIIAESEETWKEPEACLSIPGIWEQVERARDIVLEYYNANMELKRRQFSGYTAKVIQHELDHTNGVLFIDHLPSLTKRMLQPKLKRIKNGKVATDYPVKFNK